ncbi:MAG: penicillin-binding transpeptidase domain-containing protein, partial [Bacteroidales bacterium]|nr:penicillin-binding transpeptidase domain-containing protein [Bacteroidales bacterium]
DSEFMKELPALCDSLADFDPSKSAEQWKTTLLAAKEKKSHCYKLIDHMVTHSEFERLRKFPFLNKSNKILYGERLMRRKKPFGSMAARSIGNVSDPILLYQGYINWKHAAFNADEFNRQLPALCDSLASVFPRTPAEEWKEMLLRGSKERSETFQLLKKPVEKNVITRISKFPFLRQSKEMFYSQLLKNSDGGRHGITGLEMFLDNLLFGIPAKAPRVALNANTANYGEKPTPGYDVTTTINIQLQDIVENELVTTLKNCNGRWGCAILMEVSTGEIKAISNLDRDPATGQYREGENHAVLGYEPGSVLKPINMMVALEDGIVNDLDEVVTTGHTYQLESGISVRDEHGAGSFCIRDIIAKSSNVGMCRIMWRKYAKNPDGLRQRLEGMGFFEPFNTGIAGERQPRYRVLKNNKEGRLTLRGQSFGYDVYIPPIYTLAIYNSWANDGKFVRPRLIKKLSREGEPDSIVPVSYVRKQVCSPENAAKMRELLHGVVWRQGTARSLRDSTVHLAGKTGTAYISGGKSGYGSARRLAFCGFFPYEKPMYSCMVLIAGDGNAASTSGTVMKNIALKLHARGLLGNASDYRRSTTGAKGDAEAPMVTAATDRQSRNSYIKEAVGETKTVHTRTPQNHNKGVPNVVGLNLRDALVRLERLGLRVECEGVGIVTSQSVAPGSAYHRGTSIKLHLSNNPRIAKN